MIDTQEMLMEHFFGDSGICDEKLLNCGNCIFDGGKEGCILHDRKDIQRILFPILRKNLKVVFYMGYSDRHSTITSRCNPTSEEEKEVLEWESTCYGDDLEFYRFDWNDKLEKMGTYSDWRKNESIK